MHIGNPIPMSIWFLVYNSYFFVGMGIADIVPSHPSLCFFLLFLFWLFSSCCWDGRSEIVIRESTWCHVCVDGMRLRKHAGNPISTAFRKLLLREPLIRLLELHRLAGLWHSFKTLSESWIFLRSKWAGPDLTLDVPIKLLSIAVQFIFNGITEGKMPLL